MKRIAVAKILGIWAVFFVSLGLLTEGSAFGACPEGQGPLPCKDKLQRRITTTWINKWPCGSNCPGTRKLLESVCVKKKGECCWPSDQPMPLCAGNQTCDHLYIYTTDCTRCGGAITTQIGRDTQQFEGKFCPL